MEFSKFSLFFLSVLNTQDSNVSDKNLRCALGRVLHASARCLGFKIKRTKKNLLIDPIHLDPDTSIKKANSNIASKSFLINENKVTKVSKNEAFNKLIVKGNEDLMDCVEVEQDACEISKKLLDAIPIADGKHSKELHDDSMPSLKEDCHEIEFKMHGSSEELASNAPCIDLGLSGLSRGSFVESVVSPRSHEGVKPTEHEEEQFHSLESRSNSSISYEERKLSFENELAHSADISIKSWRDTIAQIGKKKLLELRKRGEMPKVVHFNYDEDMLNSAGSYDSGYQKSIFNTELKKPIEKIRMIPKIGKCKSVKDVRASKKKRLLDNKVAMSRSLRGSSTSSSGGSRSSSLLAGTPQKIIFFRLRQKVATGLPVLNSDFEIDGFHYDEIHKAWNSKCCAKGRIDLLAEF